MTTSELHFSAPGPKFYAQGLGLSVVGIGFLAWGTAGVAITPRDWIGALPLLGGIFLILLGAPFLLFVWFTFVSGTITIWRRWRQFRQPAALIDAAGVCYQATRKPVMIPWTDIDQVALDRTILPKSVVTKVSLRLTPDAAVLHDGTITAPAGGYLNVGLMSDLATPEDIAMRFLAKAAGTRLKITEVDRRSTVDHSSY